MSSGWAAFILFVLFFQWATYEWRIGKLRNKLDRLDGILADHLRLDWRYEEREEYKS